MDASEQLNLLYVEDDVLDVKNLQREFQKINTPFNIHIAKNGAEALDMLYGKNGYEKIEPAPSAILLDINLPKINGLEFLTKLRQDSHFNSTLVFIVTANYSSKDKIAFSHLNISGCIIKPLERSDALNISWSVTSNFNTAGILFSS